MLIRFAIVLLIGLGAGASCRDTESTPSTPGPVVASQPAATAPSGPGLELRPATPDTILEAIRAPGAKATLVNIWATWCVPCREEFPELMALHRDYGAKGLRLVLVSGDFASQKDAALSFLRQQGVDFPTWLKLGGDEAFIDAFHPSWAGSLPASFLYDSQGQQRRFWPGKIGRDDVEPAIRTLIAGRSLPASQ
jgi:thiol-disulfide isomerase/thioredoxin